MKYRIKIEQIDYNNNVTKTSQVEATDELLKNAPDDGLIMLTQQLVRKFREDHNVKQPQKTYAVTGEDHGSIVQAPDEEAAKELFSKHYKGERIIHVKDISDYNLKNL